MKKYTVIIPTTNNVVGINDIVEENPLVSSVICENNNLEALPISPFYNSFVKVCNLCDYKHCEKLLCYFFYLLKYLHIYSD